MIVRGRSGIDPLPKALRLDVGFVKSDDEDGNSARAKVKLNVLKDARDLANHAKSLYQSSRTPSNGLSPESCENIYKNWVLKEIELADAYSKAIKYTAKLRTENAAKKAQGLLDEMIARHESIQIQSNFVVGDDGTLSDETVKKLINAVEQDVGKSAPSFTTTQETCSNGFAIHHEIPVPDAKDFTNVLHAWASSKVRRKGLYAESILYRMMELAFFYPEKFSMPDSKIFGLVVKCHAGSTLKDARSRIVNLHRIHKRLADIQSEGILMDDPFLLMHSIKSINNYNDQEERILVDEWFHRLHNHIMNTSSNDAQSKADSGHEKIDLTATYSAVVRGYSKVKIENDGPHKTYHVLEQMINLAKRCKQSDSPANVDLKVNTFNLFFGTSTAFSDTTILEKKLSLLQAMVEAANYSLESTEDSATSSPLLPHPNDQSFASCVKSMSTLRDTSRAIREAEQLLSTYERLKNRGMVDSSTKVYNAVIELYIDLSARDKNLSSNIFSICDEICNRMKSSTPSPVIPDGITFALLIKSCAIDGGNIEDKTKLLNRATELFDQVSKQKNDSGEGSIINDKCYFYMMKCVSQYVNNTVERNEQIKTLFVQASSGGFVSSDVLTMLRNNTSAEEYSKIVGNGRLANHWVANVTSGVALYTDGTIGGAGKNARRKGKSTSDWTKKQRQKEQELMNRKIVKAEKRRIKRETKMAQSL